MRWGLIGASAIAALRMVGAIRDTPGNEVVAICSASRERGERFARAHEIPRAYVGSAALLDAPTVDAVYISSANSLHHAEVLAAAAAGKHVLCEKPLATTIVQAWDAVDTCERAGVVLAVNHHMRLLSWITQIRGLIDDGVIGRPEGIRMMRIVDLRPDVGWRLSDHDAGGAFLDLTVHDADLARYLLADEIIAVQAFAVADRPDQAEHTVAGTMRSSGDAVVSFHSSLVRAHTATQLEVLGETGTIVAVDGLTVAPTTTLSLISQRRETQLPRLPYVNPYAATIAAFTGAVAGERLPAVSGRDGAAALAIALAARSSSRTRQAVTPHGSTLNQVLDHDTGSELASRYGS